MTSQVMNKISKAKWGELVSRAQNVGAVLEEVNKLLDKYEPFDVVPDIAIPDEDEMRAMVKKARDVYGSYMLEIKEWRIKLVADGWRV